MQPNICINSKCLAREIRKVFSDLDRLQHRQKTRYSHLKTLGEVVQGGADTGNIKKIARIKNYNLVITVQSRTDTFVCKQRVGHITCVTTGLATRPKNNKSTINLAIQAGLG